MIKDRFCCVTLLSLSLKFICVLSLSHPFFGLSLERNHCLLCICVPVTNQYLPCFLRALLHSQAASKEVFRLQEVSHGASLLLSLQPLLLRVPFKLRVTEMGGGVTSMSGICNVQIKPTSVYSSLSLSLFPTVSRPPPGPQRLSPPSPQRPSLSPDRLLSTPSPPLSLCDGPASYSHQPTSSRLRAKFQGRRSYSEVRL